MATIYRPPEYKQHNLKPSESTFIPSIYLFLDTETTLHTVQGVKAHYFTLGWTCLWTRPLSGRKERKEWVFHQTFEHFNRYIERLALKIGNLHVIGHNVFFDLQASGFYEWFTLRKWKLKFYYDQGLTYILKCQKSGYNLTVLSSTNWFDFSLAKLGAALGYPKQDIDFDSCTRDELRKYCRVDVEILVKALKRYIEFIQGHDLGKFSLTKASQAFTAYRHRFMPQKILIHSEDHISELERSAYQGGRVECFELGNIRGGPFVTLDVNAMYPFVMRGNEYPCKLVTYYEGPSPEFIAERLSSFAVIALVEVDTPEPVFAVKFKNKTIFPVGKFECFVTSVGFQYGFDKGYIQKVVKVALYIKKDLFSGYVNYFHDLRLTYKAEGNDMFLLLCKYMHNSLYGKFGQLKIVTDINDSESEHDYYREEVFNMVTGRKVVITHLMNQEIVQYPEGEGDYSNVAIAAHITENARFYLWSLINEIGPRKVLYCDTDSLKVRKSDIGPLENKINPEVLGALKIEDESKTLILEGAKNYRTEHKRKIKGIPHNAVEVRPGVFTFDSFVRQVSHLRSGHITGSQVKTITRTLKHNYDKGIVLKSGKVKPFKFPLS